MNTKQIQMEICKALLNNPEGVYGCRLYDNRIAVTTDGFRAFAFFEDDCIFDKTKLNDYDLTPFFEENDEDIPLKKRKCNGYFG